MTRMISFAGMCRTKAIENCELKIEKGKLQNEQFAVFNFQFSIFHRRSRRRVGDRRGLTLYEVVLAISIFLPAMLVLTQGMGVGTRAGLSARLQSEAVMRCDSVLSEVVAGSLPMQAVVDEEFLDGGPGWTYSLEIGPGPHPDLLALQVTVNHSTQAGEVNASTTLSRLIRDPQIFIDATLMQESTSGSPLTGAFQ